MISPELKSGLPSTEELPCSDDTPVDNEDQETERQRAEKERRRADQLAQYLRSQGIDPDNLPEI